MGKHLTIDQALKIRSDAVRGFTIPALMDKYGCSQKSVYRVLSMETQHAQLAAQIDNRGAFVRDQICGMRRDSICILLRALGLRTGLIAKYLNLTPTRILQLQKPNGLPIRLAVELTKYCKDIEENDIAPGTYTIQLSAANEILLVNNLTGKYYFARGTGLCDRITLTNKCRLPELFLQKLQK